MLSRAAGSPLASLGPPVHAFRVDVGGAIATTWVHDLGDRVIIPLAAELPNGGFVRGMFEVDRRTFDQVVTLSRRYGVVPRLSDLVTRAFGTAPEITNLRPVLAR